LDDPKAAVEATDPIDAIARIPDANTGVLHTSSWGEGGYAAVWVHPSNDWIYRHLNRAAERMEELARGGDHGDPLRARALRQAGRELLLAQASDWAFIMRTGTLVPYAVRRTELHVERFRKLADMLAEGRVVTDELEQYEGLDPIFPDLDPGLFA